MASATVQLKVRPEDLSQVPKTGERIPDPGIMVIFGASGDLTKRKLLPSLFHLEQDNLLPKNFAIVGVARRPLGNEFAEDMRQGIIEFGGVKADDPKLDEFVSKINYYALSFDDASHYAGLKAELDRIATEKNIGPDRLFYLATAPEYFTPIVENLGQLNHGVIRQFRNLHLQHSHLFPGLFNGRTSVAAGAFLSVRDRQLCEGLKIRILRQFAIANRVVPGITRFFPGVAADRRRGQIKCPVGDAGVQVHAAVILACFNEIFHVRRLRVFAEQRIVIGGAGFRH